MRSPNDLWEALGEISQEETEHLLTRIFAMYEKRLATDPGDREAQNFFTYLDTALSQTRECNLNRR
jgi:hypothetical protein